MCKVTYLYHSGFMVELESAYLIFDYYKGDISVADSGKKVIVFASHRHPDHFNPEIFKIFPDSLFVLGYDIWLRKRDGTMRYEEISEEQADKAYVMRFGEKLTLRAGEEVIEIHTVKSTDSGVAFLVFAEGKIIYHAGDLNDWCREELDKSRNNNMTAMFKQRLETIKNILVGRKIDIGFLPLDPKQGRYYGKGMEEFLGEIFVRDVYPMHMWDGYEYIEKFRQEHESSGAVVHNLTENDDRNVI